MGKKKDKLNRKRERLLSISSESSEDTYYNEKQYLRGGPKPKYFQPKTKNQYLFLNAIQEPEYNIIICHGSAGSGKTLFSCQEAIRSFYNKEVDRIIITRPAVCADEDIGFLPGDLDDKMKPFTQPLFDTFEKIIDQPYIGHMLQQSQLQIIPLAYMRGRTFENKFIIADEMQNSSIEQMFMLLTRLGKGSTLVIVGDPSQCDRKHAKYNNGLSDLIKRFANPNNVCKKIKCIQLESKDIQREEVVKEVINNLYSDYDKL